MDSEVLDLITSVSNILMQESKEYGKTFLEVWKNKCQVLLAKAKILLINYIELNNTEIFTDSAIASIYQEQKYDLAIDRLVKEMYYFLNQVSDTLRGEAVQYEVTLSTGRGKNKQMTTFFLNLEEFLNITSKSKSRLTLKKTKTILNSLNKNNTIKKRDWTSEEIFAFQRFIFNAKRIESGRWKKVNRGNMLEAFYRYQQYRSQGMHRGVTNLALLETMRGTQGFWQGGDVGNIQIKGNSASVVTIFTCVNQLNELYKVLSLLEFNEQSQILNKIKESSSSLDSTINEYASQTTDELLLHLIKQFNITKKS